MTDKKTITRVLRDASKVQCIKKGVYEVQSTAVPVTLKLKKSGLYVGGARTVPYNLARSYLRGLLNEHTGVDQWTRPERTARVALLSSLYGDRVLTVGKVSFDIDDPEDPTRVHISRSGEVKIIWSNGGGENMYSYDDSVRHLTEYGPRPIPNLEYTGFATMQEIEASPELTAKLLGPAYPQPPDISIDAIRSNALAVISTIKQYWHHVETNTVFVTEPGADVTRARKDCAEIAKFRFKELTKRQGATRVKIWPPKPKKAAVEIIEGGAPLKKKAFKKATKAAAKIKTVAGRVRMLIEKYDADNVTITEVAQCDDKAVQRVRRKILKEGE